MKKPRKPQKPAKPKKPAKNIVGERRSSRPYLEFDNSVTLADFDEAAKELVCSPEDVVLCLSVDEAYYRDETTCSRFFWKTDVESGDPNYLKKLDTYFQKYRKYEEKLKQYNERMKTYLSEKAKWDSAQIEAEKAQLRQRLDELEAQKPR